MESLRFFGSNLHLPLPLEASSGPCFPFLSWWCLLHLAANKLLTSSGEEARAPAAAELQTRFMLLGFLRGRGERHNQIILDPLFFSILLALILHSTCGNSWHRAWFLWLLPVQGAQVFVFACMCRGRGLSVSIFYVSGARGTCHLCRLCSFAFWIKHGSGFGAVLQVVPFLVWITPNDPFL